MLKNYFKVALRGMMSQKVFTFINISGLATGIAACLLILLFVKDEMSYDRYHKNADNIYRVSREWFGQDGKTSLHLGHLAPPFKPLLLNDFEGTILEGVRLLSDGPLITYGEKKIVEEHTFFAEASIFNIFSYEMVKGNPETALSEPNSLVMTESTAQKYFGDEEPIGKMVNYDNLTEMKVTGIIKDVPQNSHFHFDILASFSTVENFFGEEEMMTNFGSNNYSTFLLLPEGYNPDDLESQFPSFLNNHLQTTSNGIKPEQYNKFHLMPLTDIHLHSHLDSEIEANGDIAYIYIYSVVALFILLIAAINFMNLSTARSVKRSKEVGVRKVMGANKLTLIRQFLVESIIVTFLAVILAMVIVTFAMPYFNDFAQKAIDLHLNDPFIWFTLAGVTILVGLMAGSYPAFVLSSFRPIAVLKALPQSGKKGAGLRSALVVLQFTISIALIVGVAIVHQQLDFVKTKSLGFDEANILSLPSSDEIGEQFDMIKEQLEAHPGIVSVSNSSRVPSGRLLDSQGTTAEVGGEMVVINSRIADIHVGHDFFKTYGMEITEGRGFNKEIASDSLDAFVLNESAVNAIGWENPEEAINKKITYGGRTGYLAGIVKDFHFENLRQPIVPIIFLVSPRRNRNVSIKFVPEKRDEVVAMLQEKWSYLRPGHPFDYQVISDRFDQQYGDEERLSELITLFSGLAIIIACLGLFGLASFTAEQRTKEIGIRKVLGASVGQVFMLLIKGIVALVGISLVLASPIAYYFMDQWLGEFAYSTSINLWAFVIAGVVALLIAISTVGYQALKAAIANPVKSLRSE
ncbi:FtsX-like permease family protein [Flammeovirgaceae bacterium SG7u.111]|nr:FtsX-like permease family protein [Flammeovirgaceae bacterium SG7u.132]WPO34808.1 FtsX-like permease family protein [Flammeovirgaceae bacterium SG7u.111]